MLFNVFFTHPITKVFFRLTCTDRKFRFNYREDNNRAKFYKINSLLQGNTGKQKLLIINDKILT